MIAEQDPSDPGAWWRMTVDAVIGIKRNDKLPAVRYLQFVERERGREIAELTRARLLVYASTPSWDTVAQWPGWGYACKSPRREEITRKTKRKRHDVRRG